MAEDPQTFIDAEFEDADFAPCSSAPWKGVPCGSERRIARLFYDPASGKAQRAEFLCDQDHTNTWETGGVWIPLDVFGPDGDYPAMFPSKFFQNKAQRQRSVSFEINETMQYQHRTAANCAVCGAPPFAGGSRFALFEWLRNHRPEFFERSLRSSVEAFFTEKAEYDDGWYEALPAELRAEIEKHTLESKMTADHGVPQSILDKIRTELSSAERNVARGALTFPLCVRCNRSRRDTLDAFSVLEERFARVYTHGNLAAARRLESWPHIVSLYWKAAQQRDARRG